MFASASNADLADLPTVNLTLLATIFGTVRSVFERNLSSTECDNVLGQLISMCTTYLAVVRVPQRCG
ncbi:hypothetical protein A5892_09045 [Halotalea alkalilenta]|uniref:Uncharacterized protein n=1 Tax=Halotalea alkalilenta TaxID=376489 RepID=A0A172YET0_9GAMM|nr:hypothetical protein A5892_09045 [Halotalea alkalilenta]